MSETVSDAVEPFRVLYVCTGNICRSPYAALHTRFLLEAWLGRGAGRFEIASAGVGAVVGSEMHPFAREQLATRRDHPAVEAFRARQLPDPEVAAADLVLTMNRRQRSRVLSDVPRALRRTFTLREFARLLGTEGAVDPASLPADPVERARAAVPAALAARAAAGPVPSEDDAVGDPIGGEPEAHAEAARAIDAAVRRILGVLVPPPPPQWRPAPASHRGRAPMPPGRPGAVTPPARPGPAVPPPFPPRGRPLPRPEQGGTAIAASAIPAPRDGAAPVPHDSPVAEPVPEPVPEPAPRPSRAAVITLSPRPRSA